MKARCRVWKRFRVAEVIEMIEVLHHQLDNLRLVADVVALGRGLVVRRDCLELDGASVSLLLRISHDHVNICGQRHHLKRALPECCSEVF